MKLRPRLNRRFVFRSTILIVALWSLGQVFRDRTWVTGLCFYIPTLVVFVGLCVVGIWQWAAGEKRQSKISLAAAFVPAFFFVCVENSRLVRAPVRAAATDYTLVHWNVASGRLGWNRIRQRLLEQRADIYLISEPPRTSKMGSMATTFGDVYQSQRFGSMLVIAKGRIAEGKWLIRSNTSQVYSFLWQYNGDSLRIFSVDLISDIIVARDPLLRQLSRLAVEYQPDLIVGDFNAPRRSHRLANMADGYRHAYDVCGHGIGYTWPVPLPMYALDQCILGPRISGHRYELKTFFLSDHRLQRLEFQLRSLNAPPQPRATSPRATGGPAGVDSIVLKPTQQSPAN
jgi:hypothetical protein